jgi:hypothetical protein
MGKQLLSTIRVAVVALVALVAIALFWKNPFRVGEITIATRDGGSMTFKVANSNEISELIRRGLENEKSAEFLTNSLLSIIEQLPPGSALGEKLVEMAEMRRPPFSFKAVPVKLVYAPKVPRGRTAVCEQSGFLGKNLAVFVMGDEDEMLDLIQAYAEAKLAVPCPGGGETLRLNNPKVEEFNRHKVMAKRTL